MRKATGWQLSHSVQTMNKNGNHPLVVPVIGLMRQLTGAVNPETQACDHGQTDQIAIHDGGA